MQTLIRHYVALTSYLRDREEGATAVEYGVMVALIAAVIIATVTTLGLNLKTLFGDVAAKITSVG